MNRGGQIVLYHYQKTRKADHPREFLKDFEGFCVTDGYQVCHAIENEREEGKLSGLPLEERLEPCRQIIKAMAEAYFAWAKKKLDSVLSKSKIWNGLSYSINQKKYLLRFLDDGEIPVDNNAAEQSIRSFCIGKKNWVMIDTISGANASAVIYSLTETAKANNLKPYEYIKHLLEEIPQHMDESSKAFLEDLLPWSDKLSDECRKIKNN